MAASTDGPLRVLVVATEPRQARRLAAWVRRGGHIPTVLSDFVHARQALADNHDLLLSTLKLGAYNGLHLALRARAQAMPAIVLGHPDQTLAREASRLRARYISTPLTRERLLHELQRTWATRPLHHVDEPHTGMLADYRGQLDLEAYPIDSLRPFKPIDDDSRN